MKAFRVIVKIMTVLAAVAGAVYLLATYGEQIVQWSKKVLASMPSCPVKGAAEGEKADEASAPAAEMPVEDEAAPKEEPAPEVIASSDEPVAEESDFAE